MGTLYLQTPGRFDVEGAHTQDLTINHNQICALLQFALHLKYGVYCKVPLKSIKIFVHINFN